MSYPPPPHQPPPGQPYGAPPGYPVQPPPKKTSPLKVVLITVGAVLAVCVGGGVVVALVSGGDAPAKKPGAQVVDDAQAGKSTGGAAKPKEPQGFGVKPGTTVRIAQDDAVLDVTVKSAKGHKGGCNSFAPDPKNGMYVIADVSVRVVEGSTDINPLGFKWVAPDGSTSDVLEGAFSGCEKSALDSSSGVRAGQQRSGQMVFDAPSAKGELEFTPDIFGKPAASWKFA